MVADSATILKRFYFLERELVLLQAGWLPAVEHWESKLLLPEILWQSAVLTSEFRKRILELRFPERRLQIDDSDGVLRFLPWLGEAPSAAAFVHALGHAIKPHVLSLYRHYEDLADKLNDGPTLFFLRHAMTDLESHITRLRSLGEATLQAFPEQAGEAMAWSTAVQELMDSVPAEVFFSQESVAIGEVASLENLRQPFAIRRTGVRDRRFTRAAFAWPDRHTPQEPGEGLQLQIRQAVHHINEVWAAEMAAACLYDFGRDGPHEFFEEAARWCYDEIRHCRMGYERLKAWGFADADIPLDAFSYNAGAGVDALVRLGIIFFFETTYIHTKPARTKIFAAMGDRLSSHDMDFDWADELIHTHYGKKWLQAFLAESGDPRSLNDIKEEGQNAVKRQQAAATEANKAESLAIFHALLSKVRPASLL